MRQELEEQYELNLARVRKLVEIHQRLAREADVGDPVEAVDVLRAAVVFLHATLEDVLRTLLARRWPNTADVTTFEDLLIAVAPGVRQAKVTLADLALHRGKSVDELVERSIDAHLERSNFNHLGDVKNALRRCGVDIAAVTVDEGALAAMMSRRHQIVHRADGQDIRDSGTHRAATLLGLSTVQAWIAAVDDACKRIVAGL